jgi:hemoglobin
MPNDAPALHAELDIPGIVNLVDRFYDKVRVDDHIGPVFNAVIEDWAVHKNLLTSFWCSVALRVGTYRGNPLAMHKPLGIDRTHFVRWLALWRETVPEIFAEEPAARMIEYAERIGRGMRMGLGLGDRPLGRDLDIPIRMMQP